MKKASTRLLEQETQTPSPAPDLIPAESSTENLHWDWYSKRGHFIGCRMHFCQASGKARNPSRHRPQSVAGHCGRDLVCCFGVYRAAQDRQRSYSISTTFARIDA